MVARSLLILGAAFIAVAGIGVVRFGDLLARMHAATKASTIGVVLMAAGTVAVLDEGAVADVLIASVLLFVTAPAAAHLVGRAAYRDGDIEIGLDGPDELLDEDPDRS